MATTASMISSSTVRAPAGVKAPRAFSGMRPLSVAALSKMATVKAAAPRTASAVVTKAAASPAGASEAASTGPAPVNTSGKKLAMVFVAAEVAPWSKTGGLGDVVGGLPVELAKRGHKVMTVAPRYDQYKDGWDTSVTVNIMGEDVRFFHSVKKGVDRVFIDHPWFLAKVWGKTGSKLYGLKSGADFVDNPERFRLFCEAALEATRCLPFSPGEDCVVVANDWHSALVPVLLKEKFQPEGQFMDTKCALVVHNIAFQGRFWAEDFDRLALPESARELFEFEDGYPKIFTADDPASEDGEEKLPAGVTFAKSNWLQAGFMSADKLLTVSPNYATEITAGADTGVEMDQVILEAGGIEGIVNGFDDSDWNPKKDKFIDMPYDKDTVKMGKAAAKAALQAECGLPVDPEVPIFGFIGRLEEQKGCDIMFEAIPKLVEEVDCQVVVLGTGKKSMEKTLKGLEKLCPGKAFGMAKFSTPMAHAITAGADFMLVPSRFEPCGLIQLHAMCYGTVPVVSSTGGLVDTVKEGVTGFHMGMFDLEDCTPEDVDAIVETCSRAAEVYATPAMDTMVDACIAQDLTWTKPAMKWEAVLQQLSSGEEAEVVAEKKEGVKTPVEIA